MMVARVVAEPKGTDQAEIGVDLEGLEGVSQHLLPPSPPPSNGRHPPPPPPTPHTLSCADLVL